MMNDKEPTVTPRPTKTGIPLVFASDELYAMPLATALRSIAEAKRTTDTLEVYILYDTFQDGVQSLVMNSLPPGSLSIHWVRVDIHRFEAYSTSPYISKITYARLLLPELLPRYIKKIVYLDADILVFEDLSALQEIDLNGAALGAVLDRLDSRIKAGDKLWTTDLPRVRDYFNAGVVLIDLERWREERISERALEYLSQHPNSPLSDQDALNVVCDGTWKRLEPRWNVLNDHKMQMSNQVVGQGPAIIHFAGPLKPWQIGILDPNAPLYDGIRSRTCFARTIGNKLKDAVQAPWRFYQSGLWWQLRRALRRIEALRRIRLYVLNARRVKAVIRQQ